MPAAATVSQPSLTQQQIDSQIQSLKWQEQEQSAANTFNRQLQAATLKQSAIAADQKHFENVADKVYQPLGLAMVFLICLFAVFKIAKLKLVNEIPLAKIRADLDVKKNQDWLEHLSRQEKESKEE